MMESLGKMLIVLGGVLVVLGVALLLAKDIPFLGRLPGDILVRRKNFTFYFPLTTSIALSLVLSLILYLLTRK